VDLGQNQEYSVIGSIIQLWDSGAVPLAVVLFAMAICWPYLKLLSMLSCFLLPPSHLSAKWRGKIIHTLDLWGKYSFVEIYFVSFLLAILRVSIQSPALAGSSEGALFSLDLVALSLPSLFVFLSALILSLVLSNVLLRLHTQIEKEVRDAEDEVEGVANAGTLFNAETEQGGGYARTSILASCAFAFVAGIFVVMAWYKPNMKIGRHGYAKLLFTLQGDPTSTDIGLASIFSDFMSSADTGETFLGFFLLCTLGVMPMASVVYHVWFFFAPSTRAQRIYRNDVRLVIQSWSSLEVFVIAALFTTFELEYLTESIVENDQCDSLGAAVSQFLVPFGLIDEEDIATGCFKISATLQIGVYFALFGVLSLLACNATVNPYCDFRSDGKGAVGTANGAQQYTPHSEL
jgi:hypothetical protein